VRILWPDGEGGPAMPAEVDAFGIITRGSTAIEPWVPRR